MSRVSHPSAAPARPIPRRGTRSRACASWFLLGALLGGLGTSLVFMHRPPPPPEVVAAPPPAAPPTFDFYERLSEEEVLVPVDGPTGKVNVPPPTSPPPAPVAAPAPDTPLPVVKLAPPAEPPPVPVVRPTPPPEPKPAPVVRPTPPPEPKPAPVARPTPPPEPPLAVRPPPRPEPLPTPPAARPTAPEGVAYRLQVGSFRDVADAERIKAELALQGVRAEIQPIDISGVVTYRVRTGVYDQANAETLRARLRAAGRDSLLVRER